VLKRRDSGTDAETNRPESSEDNGRPVLKRRDGSSATDPSETTKPETSTSPEPATDSKGDSSGRPVLKRRSDSTDPATGKPNSSSTGNPASSLASNQ
jgi:hypothetical protein